ncbi:MAG: GmrSD restriction endonuclease domain-containing protein [Terriglobales bacterium]
METITIREIIDQVLRGQIRIPAFQRGFVWEPDRVAYLMDSIYKKYPFGSLLFWRTKEKLKVERDLGPFTLPEPQADYPIDYVLDGQQRVTAIFGVFQTDLAMVNPIPWENIYFDLGADTNAQDPQFVALSEDEVNFKRHFPLNTIFDTSSYRKATKDFDDDTAKRIDDMQAVFKETQIPRQLSSTDDKATVAIIFERVNRQGVPLDTLQLLSAWTWSEDFQLHEQFTELSEQLGPFGFAEVGEDTNLLLRCCAAVLVKDAAPEALMGLNGQTVRDNFKRILNGVKGAVDYLRSNFNVFSLANLPFPTVLVPLSVFFAADGNEEAKYTDEHRQAINRWFWRTAFSKRYSAGVLRNLKADIDDMEKMRDGKEHTLGVFQMSVSDAFFTDNIFGMGNVNTKSFILMLAQARPRSFISGAPLNLAEKLRESNRTEFHHLMPRAFLKSSGQTHPSDSVLANFAFLSRADNRELGGAPPSEYLSKMAKNVDEILASALCPEQLFDDEYEPFLLLRSSVLTKKANELCA